MWLLWVDMAGEPELTGGSDCLAMEEWKLDVTSGAHFHQPASKHCVVLRARGWVYIAEILPAEPLSLLLHQRFTAVTMSSILNSRLEDGCSKTGEYVASSGSSSHLMTGDSIILGSLLANTSSLIQI